MNGRIEEGRAYEGERAYVVKQDTRVLTCPNPLRGSHYLRQSTPLKAGRTVYRIIEEVYRPENYPYPAYYHTTFRHLGHAQTWYGLTHKEKES